MSENAVVIQGMVRADGTLQLDGKVPLPPGKVSVMIQPVTALPEWAATLDLPRDDPFVDMLRRIWSAREKGKPFRTGEQVQEDLRRLRDEAAEEVAEIGRLQEECRRQRLEAEAAKEEG